MTRTAYKKIVRLWALASKGSTNLIEFFTQWDPIFSFIFYNAATEFKFELIDRKTILLVDFKFQVRVPVPGVTTIINSQVITWRRTTDDGRGSKSDRRRPQLVQLH